jgi:alkaline phosphatase D
MTRRRQLLGLALAAGAAPGFVRFAWADEARFALGIASGSPHAAGMVLWTRLTGDGLPANADVRWEVAHDEAFQRIAARGIETALDADAHTVHAEPTGLDPDRWYFYRFQALGQTSMTGRTRTAPAADAAVGKLEFAIASCQRWDHGHYAAWRHAAAEPLDLVLFLGDYIYEYATNASSVRPHEGGTVRSLAEYRARYAQYKRDPALQAAHAACPWLVIADDHEVENDYAGLQGETLQFGFAGRREAAYRAWWEHMPLPKAARPKDGALPMSGRLAWGRLARLHWVDDRQYRDKQACQPFGRGGSSVVKVADCAELADPKRSLLGAAQERWLADGWDLDRPWNLLAQQTLMARFDGKSAWTDGWDGYPAARQRLLATLAERKVPGAVVFGGDVHTHYVADLKLDWDDPKAPVVASEFCGTSITSRSGLPQERLDRALAEQPHLKLARGDRRGYTRFTLDAQRLQAQLLGVDDVRNPASAVSTLARFVVDAARPGPRAA